VNAAFRRSPVDFRRSPNSGFLAVPRYCYIHTDLGTHMNVETAYRWRKQLVWGLALIAVGSVMLLALDLLDSTSTGPSGATGHG
jgi:hypothetical protein